MAQISVCLTPEMRTAYQQCSNNMAHLHQSLMQGGLETEGLNCDIIPWILGSCKGNKRPF